MATNTFENEISNDFWEGIAMSLTIRGARASDAASIGRLAGEFADYLRSLGDASEFNLTAEAYLPDGFGHPRLLPGWWLRRRVG